MTVASRSKGKAAVLVGGVVVMILLGVGAACWKKLCVAYYVYRLQSDTNQFMQLIVEPEDSAAGMAIAEFVASKPGADRLFERYLDLIERSMSRRHKIGLAGILGKALLRLQPQHCNIEWKPQAIPGTGGTSYQLDRTEANDATVICRLLRHVDNMRFSSARFNGLQFVVLHKDAALPLYHGRSFTAEQKSGLEEYMCIVEREGK